MPTRRQKSARLVQQAMLTCWQLSTCSPVTGSVNELARPPSRGRLSRRVIRSPRPDQRRGGRQAGQAAADDDHVGRGAVSTTGSAPGGLREIRLGAGESARERSDGDGRLPPGGQGDPRRQDVVVAAGDLVEQGPIDADDRPEHGTPHRRDQAGERGGLAVVTRRRVGLRIRAARGPESPGWAASRSSGATPNRVQVFLGQVDPPVRARPRGRRGGCWSAAARSRTPRRAPRPGPPRSDSPRCAGS